MSVVWWSPNRVWVYLWARDPESRSRVAIIFPIFFSLVLFCNFVSCLDSPSLLIPGALRVFSWWSVFWTRNPFLFAVRKVNFAWLTFVLPRLVFTYPTVLFIFLRRKGHKKTQFLSLTATWHDTKLVLVFGNLLLPDDRNFLVNGNVNFMISGFFFFSVAVVYEFWCAFEFASFWFDTLVSHPWIWILS